MATRKHTVHRCPQCREYTDEKCYCRACRDLIKKPYLVPPTIPYHKISFEWR